MPFALPSLNMVLLILLLLLLLLSSQGGQLLADQGLHSGLSEEQLHALALAEVVPPTYKLLKVGGSSREATLYTSTHSV